MKSLVLSVIAVGVLSSSLSGCLLAAGAAGAEAGYVGSQEHRTAGQTVDDQVVLTSVKSKLLADPEVSGLSINVDVYKGAVKLKGYVKSQHEIDRAVELARKTDGVTGVDSMLVLDR